MHWYARYIRHLKNGIKTNPRGINTTAIFNASVSFEAGSCIRRPKDNPAIGIMEGLQFIAGIADKEAIAVAAPHVNLDLFGATSFYGPRTRGQFTRVIKELQKDPKSRRATVVIASPIDSSETMPCTLSMCFWFLPDTKILNTTIMMRSSDAVWGLPYDMIQFGMINMAIANCLDALPGQITVNIANAHVYEDHKGGKTWYDNRFYLPNFSTFEKYVTWAMYAIDYKFTRPELEQYVSLRMV